MHNIVYILGCCIYRRQSAGLLLLCLVLIAIAPTVSFAQPSFLFGKLIVNSKCLAKTETFDNLYAPMVGEHVDPADIVAMMREMRNDLIEKGYSNVRTSFPISKMVNGEVIINISAIPPKELLGTMPQCKQKVLYPEQQNSTAILVRDVKVEGVTSIDKTQFDKYTHKMKNKIFNAVEVVGLMHKIREAYRSAGHRLPHIKFDNKLAKKGIVFLKIIEREQRNIPALPVKLEKVPVKVAVPITKADIEYLQFKGLELINTPEMRAALKKLKEQPRKVAVPQKNMPPKSIQKKLTKKKRIVVEKPIEKVAPLTPLLQPDTIIEPTGSMDTTSPSGGVEETVMVDGKELHMLDADTPQNLKYIERSEEQLLILETFVGNTPRADAILAYMTDDNSKLLLSLTGFVDAIGIDIEVNPEQGVGQGSLFNNKGKFHLQFPFKHVSIGKEQLPLANGDAELHFDDIYVSAKTLEKWFDVDINLNSSEMRIFINPVNALPFQEKVARMKLWERTLANRKIQTNRTEPPRQDIPYQFVAKPTVRADASTSFQNVNNKKTSNNTLNLISRGDLLFMSSQSTLSLLKKTDEKVEVDSFDIVLSRQDNTGNLLGPLKATSIQLGDINTTSVPLISGTRIGRGMEVTNEPSGFVRDPDNLTIQGFAPPGWDVEIFQDERLLAFQTIDNTGRYEFNTIPLRTGLNIFRIIKHGPNGELSEGVRRFFLGPGMIKQGEFIYSLTAIESNKPLIGIGNNADQIDRGEAFQTTFNYGLNQNVSLTGSLYDGPLNTLNTQAASLGARVSLFETYIQLDGMMEANGGKIASVTARRNIANTLQLLVGGVNSSGFSSDTRTEKSELFARLDKSITLGTLNPIGFSLEYKRKVSNNNQRPITIFRNRINTFVERITISNEIEIEDKGAGTSKNLLGDFLIRRNIKNGFIRGKALYSHKNSTTQIDAINLRGQVDFGNNLTYTGEVNKELSTINKETRITNSLNWNWGAVRVGINGQFSDEGDVRLGLNLGTTFTPEQNGFKAVSNPAAAGEGTVLARVFVDANEDNIYQNSEKVLPGVTVRNQTKNSNAETDMVGIASLTKMAPFRANHVSLEQDTLPDFYLKPANKVVNIIARPGVIGTVDIPVHQLGEIAGTISLVRGNKTVTAKGVPIILVDKDNNKIGQVRSEFDGFFVFPSLKMGTYTIIIPKAFLKQHGLNNPLEIAVSLDYENPINDQNNIEIIEPQNG